MEESMRNKLKIGFTVARWGLDLCFGALIIDAAAIASSVISHNLSALTFLRATIFMCVTGLFIFVVGRFVIGLQSRKLNLNTERPLTEEERWFVACMLEVEGDASSANFASAASKLTEGSTDDLASGVVASGVTRKFFKVGKRFMGRNLLINRFPLIASLLVAAVTTVTSLI